MTVSISSCPFLSDSQGALDALFDLVVAVYVAGSWEKSAKLN